MDGFTTQRLPLVERRRRLTSALAERGAPGADRAAKILASMLDVASFAPFLESVLAAVAQAADPVRAAYALADASVRCREAGLDPTQLWIPQSLNVLVPLAGASAWASRVMVQDPTMAVELGHRLQQGDVDRRLSFVDAVVRLTTNPGPAADFDRRLRRFRNRQLLRIALRELRGVPVRESAQELSDLADVCMDAALSYHRASLHDRFGTPDPANRCVVLGMGKLGGAELNFSSDVDVIYAYEHDDGHVGDLRPHEFFVRLFERVTASLREVTDSGFVFRVDLDLRPEGRQGPLANSLPSMERYYETWGRTWERSVWLRARPIAGDLDLGIELKRMLRPFVFRRSLDLGQVEALVDMKARIDAEAHRHRKKRLDLKLGTGGIRELEFFVQAHQLLLGGRDPRLQVSNTLEALRSLTAGGHVSSRSRAALEQAYDWLRALEHRVQLVDDQQTHILPTDPEALLSLARSMGLDGPEALITETERHMGEVATHFDELLGRVDDTDPLAPEIDVMLDPDHPPTARLEAAHRAGLTRPEPAIAHLDTSMRIRGSPLHRQAPPSLRRIGLRLVRDCLESPNAGRALAHLPDLLRGLATHTSYVRELERPSVRRGVAQLMGTSDLLANILVSHPPLIPVVLRPTHSRSRAELIRDFDDTLQAHPEDTEGQLSALRKLKREAILTTAVADLGGEMSLEAVDDRLSDLAEVILEEVVRVSAREVEARYGALEDGQLVLVSGGALGAREMSYKSDLDLSALYVGSGSTAGGPRPAISIAEFCTRVVQRAITYLGLTMADGDLYEVDMRLRPSGHQGTLVTSLEGFNAYHERKAQLWERQALVRSRPVTGGPDVRREVAAALSRAAYDKEPPEPAQIRDMRERLARDNDPSRSPAADLKYGAGGLVELQFLVQFLVLRYGHDEPSIRLPRTRDALRALATADIIDARTSQTLSEAGDRLRQAQNFLRLAGDDSAVAPTDESASGELGQSRMSLGDARQYIGEAYRRTLGAA